MKKRVMKTALCIIMIIAMMTLLTACMTGTYISESNYYQVKFKMFGKCVWMQEGNFFEGKYEKEGDGVYNLLIEGSGLYTNTMFVAEEQENGDLIITGGIVFGERFVKK